MTKGKRKLPAAFKENADKMKRGEIGSKKRASKTKKTSRRGK